MSNSDLIIEERSRDIGDFLVGRLIPFRSKRMVGPFIFIDHMGPSEIGPGHYMDVDQHPHIGLSTLTYLFEGAIVHEDSIGTHQLIEPGSVNWMTAGKGVTHTERTPDTFRDGQVRNVHGYQIWVALPKHLEMMEPAFQHVKEEALPRWSDGAASFTLVAGDGYGKKSPVNVHSELFMVDVQSDEAYDLEIAGQLQGEIGICIVEGAIKACDNVIEKGNMLVSKTEDACQIRLAPKTRVLLFGGQPFEDGREIFWNFVASTKDRIEEAKDQWINKEFPKVAGDETYVPMPEFKGNFRRK
ncbi:MAG: pirin family protein [Cytophagales bacterium]|nr:pirin family protein [Cytophagales bacterium]